MNTYVYVYTYLFEDIYFFLTVKKAKFNSTPFFNTYKPVQMYLYEERYSSIWIEKKTLSFVDLYVTKIDKRSVIIKTIPFHCLPTCKLLFRGETLLHVN